MRREGDESIIGSLRDLFNFDPRDGTRDALITTQKGCRTIFLSDRSFPLRYTYIARARAFERSKFLTEVSRANREGERRSIGGALYHR